MALPCVTPGHQTTSVCCVEEGLACPETRLHFPTGSDDINHLLHWLLNHLNVVNYTPQFSMGNDPQGSDPHGAQDALGSSFAYSVAKEEIENSPRNPQVNRP